MRNRLSAGSFLLVIPYLAKLAPKRAASMAPSLTSSKGIDRPLSTALFTQSFVILKETKTPIKELSRATQGQQRKQAHCAYPKRAKRIENMQNSSVFPTFPLQSAQHASIPLRAAPAIPTPRLHIYIIPPD